MQLTPRYLISNLIYIVANQSGFVTEFRPVYSRQLQVYKGIDNVLDFRLLNAEQKPMSVYNYTPRFVAFNENGDVIINRECIVLDDGSSDVKGLFKFIITERDLLNLQQQYLTYNIYLVNQQHQLLTYCHSNFDNDATIFVNTRTFPLPKLSTILEDFTQIEQDVWTTSSTRLSENTIHSFAIYIRGFIGQIDIQATLFDNIEFNTPWTTIQSIDVNLVDDSNTFEPLFGNIIGNYKAIRFITYDNPDHLIEQILIR